MGGNSLSIKSLFSSQGIIIHWLVTANKGVLWTHLANQLLQMSSFLEKKMSSIISLSGAVNRRGTVNKDINMGYNNV